MKKILCIVFIVVLSLYGCKGTDKKTNDGEELFSYNSDSEKINGLPEEDEWNKNMIDEDGLYDKYKYPNKDFFGDELYSEIEYKASKSELEIGNQIVEKGKYTYEGTESQKADISLITCIISGDKGHVWVVYSVERYDSQGNITNASKNVLSLWYIEKYEDDWKVVEIKEAP